MADIKYLSRNVPQIAEKEVRDALLAHFGIEGEFRGLLSERDQNFDVRCENGDRVVIRIANAHENFDVIDFQVKALRHIANQNAALPVPKVIPNLRGEALCKIAFDVHDGDGDEHIVHALSYVEGTLLEDVGDVAAAPTFRNLGATMGRLDLALRGFFHPAADQDHPWNMEKCVRFVPMTKHLPSPEARKIAATILSQFDAEVMPRLRNLRHQVIHQDAHASNVLVDPADHTRIAGLIDFGDMLFGTLPAEIAVATDAVGSHSDNLIDIICETTIGFDAVYPLEEDEIDVLFDLILARNALTATIGSSRVVLSPDEPAHIETPENYVAVVDRLLTVGRKEVTRRLRAATRFPVFCPTSTDDASSESEENAFISSRHRLLGEKTTHFYKRPQHFERARGAFLYSTDGRRYLDCYNNVPQVGHCNPHVVKAIARQAAALNTNTRYMYSSVIEYADRLTDKLAPHLDACVFVNSGSEANDVAWQMAKQITGNSGAILMEDAYHGVTASIRDFSPGHPDTVMKPHLKGLIVPDPYRGRYWKGEREGERDIAEKYGDDAERAIGELVNSGHELAAFMIDSAFCSSGVPNVPSGYLQRVEKHVRAAGGLTICDEVQSGFGRMGQWWGHELHDIKADFVTMGKPVANGHPFGVVVTTSEILNEFIDKTRFFSTFGGNTVSCAAANAVLDVIERDDLIENGIAVGDYMREQLSKLSESQELIGDVRGHGMLTGLELVTNRATREPATAEVLDLLELMRERQVLVGREGRFGNILKLRPPLVFEKQHVDLLVSALDDALNQL
jgi:4-aminobutyrate aminotransferase-like enzyme/Ser/Thr protein kinase RdoA (MazF antagonist)